MRVSRFPLATLREVPADAEIVSHRLMLRAGLIRRLAAGLYTWLPLGLRVLRRVERIVREEMDAAGALEVLMPAVQPAELWQESGRWAQYGPELLRLQDRHQRAFCFGPTHEEVITDLARRELQSYRQLPVNFYQIQTKFRDEVRPRFGVMRAREFIMKDAYSFHADEDSLRATYRRMYETYSRIFTRIGLAYRAVAADTGAIGGSASHEFHVLAEAGEDAIAFSDTGDYAANVELAAALPPAAPRPAASEPMQRVATPGVASIAEVSAYLKIPVTRCVKTLLIETGAGVTALVLRGDHELNLVKVQRLLQLDAAPVFAAPEQVRATTGADPGSVGPVGLECTLLVDPAAAALADFVCGANRNGEHLTGVNWGRDLPQPRTADLRNVVVGDPSPDGHGTLTITRGIEVGHIFQLGKKYSAALNATVLDEKGEPLVMTMGCYGIGVSRIVAAAIEQNHDARGIIWPAAIAPFQLALLPINAHKSAAVRAAADDWHERLTEAGFEVLYYDIEARPGVMFADVELIGIPHRLVLGERGLAKDEIEYQARTDTAPRTIAVASIMEFLRTAIAAPALAPA